MRVSSGVAKGKNLKVPKVSGMQPSQEIVRGAIFAILFDKIKGALCLDLYAGSGSIGIEALSRGAQWCDFVDINRESTNTIEENLKATKLEGYAQVFTQDSLKYIGNCTKKYDIVFLDPYYDDIAYKHIFKTLPLVLKDESVVIYLHGKNIETEHQLEGSEFKVVDERKYGATVVSLLKLQL